MEGLSNIRIDRMHSCELLETDCKIEGLPGLQRVYGLRAVSAQGEESLWPDVDVSREAVGGFRVLLLENDVLMEELPYLVEDFVTGLYMVA